MHPSYKMKKTWFHVSLLACFVAAIVLLVILDYFNLESIALFNEKFFFDYTWKGRLFLLFFLWLFVLETSLNWENQSKEDSEIKPINFRIIASFLCAIFPLIYIISVNFLGLDQTIINLGDMLRGEYWRANFLGDLGYLLGAAWPLLVEYLVFTVSFLATILLAYGKGGLKKFGITLAFISGVSAVYFLDTIFPYGVFKPLQMLALPTAACAAALLDILGYSFTLSFSPGVDAMPIIRTQAGGRSFSVGIAWPCAGVHSLFLYTLIILLLFKKSDISRFRKMVYFIVGAIGTYSVNILRIIVYFRVLVNQGLDAAQTFHNVHAELLFVAWILLYILLIIFIQKFRLVEKTTHGIQGLRNSLERVKSKTFSHFKTKQKEGKSSKSKFKNNQVTIPKKFPDLNRVVNLTHNTLFHKIHCTHKKEVYFRFLQKKIN
jgi:thaumarchaeosortase